MGSDDGGYLVRPQYEGGKEEEPVTSPVQPSETPAQPNRPGVFCLGQVAQLVEHTTENRGVGGSIPPLAMTVKEVPRVRLKVRSSTGRAPVSKTGGWGFKSLRACLGSTAGKTG